MEISKEQKEAIEYYQNKEVSLSVDFDTEKLLKALGITEEDSLENHQIRFKTLLNSIEKLQKENEELRKQLNEENKKCMMLAIEKQDYFEKYRYHLQQNESLTKEFSNVIPVQKVKDEIRHYQELQDNYIKKYDEINESLQAMINVLQELIEESEK